MTSHLKRWLTAIIAVPLLFALIYYGSDLVFSAVITITILIGVYEYHHIVFGPGHAWEKGEGLIIGLLIPLTVHLSGLDLLLAVLSFSVLAVFFTYLLRIDDEKFDLQPVGKLVLGFMYVPLMMSYFILIHRFDQGVLWIFFILVLAFSGDVAAYYVGKTFGKKKLLPLVSPNKTVEGTLALFAGSVLGCVVYQHFFFPVLPLRHALVMGLVGSVLGQLGDLCESAIKRASGIKDSGAILPGHGGILDRLDCLIFIAPFVYYYNLFLIR
jgi:phosphatidate cytidylyltransferase